jgi:hypothetical protein
MKAKMRRIFVDATTRGKHFSMSSLAGPYFATLNVFKNIGHRTYGRMVGGGNSLSVPKERIGGDGRCLIRM